MADGQEKRLGVWSPELKDMTAAQAVRFGTALCSALLEAETPRGWHGALYPQNIAYENGSVQLGAPLELGGSFTPEEMEYLAPELFWSGVGGPATDVYAVGLLLYAACSGGRPVFTGEGGELSAEKRAEAASRRMKGEAPALPKEAGDELGQIILRAAAYREEERWPDLESLRCALEDCSAFSAAPVKDAVLSAPEKAGANAEKDAAPAPRPVEPGMKNAEVVVPVPAAEKDEKPKDKGKGKSKGRDKSASAPVKAAESAAKAEEKPSPAPEQAKKPAENASGKKGGKAAPVPENYPRPVYDVFNEKKKKKVSPLPIIVTIIALAAVFVGVLYFMQSCTNAPDEDVEPTPPVESAAPAETPDDAQPEQSVKPDPIVKPDDRTDPDGTPDDPLPEDEAPDDTPSETFAVSLLQTGSASWDEAKAACEMQGGHLPAVHSFEELSALISAAEDAGASYVWLDAKRGTDGVWRTSDGEELTYFKWFEGEPSLRDTDGTAEDYLMLWKYKGVWGYNDMRGDPGTAYAKYYGGKIAVFCQK